MADLSTTLFFFIIASFSFCQSPFYLTIFPNYPQQFRNAFYWGLNASCLVISDQQETFQIQNSYGSIAINNKQLGNNDNYTIELKQPVSFDIFMTGASIATFYNFGQSYITMNCSQHSDKGGSFVGKQFKLQRQTKKQKLNFIPNQLIKVQGYILRESVFACSAVCQGNNILAIKGIQGKFIINGQQIEKDSTIFNATNGMNFTLEVYPFSEITILNFGTSVELTCIYQSII